MRKNLVKKKQKEMKKPNFQNVKLFTTKNVNVHFTRTISLFANSEKTGKPLGHTLLGLSVAG